MGDFEMLKGNAAGVEAFARELDPVCARTHWVREMRAAWVADFFLEALVALRETADWYRARQGARLPDEGQFLSRVLSPGADTHERFAHRLMALARLDWSPPREFGTTAFLLMCETGDRVFREICAQHATYAARELVEQWVGLRKYFATAQAAGHDGRVFSKVLNRQVDGLVKLMDEVAREFAQEERLLLGQASEDADARQIMETLEEMREDVSTLARRSHLPGASAKVQKWVLETSAYYLRHPEACSGVERRRVYLRDVWDAVRSEAESRGITTFAAFRKIRKTAQKSSERKRHADALRTASERTAGR